MRVHSFSPGARMADFAAVRERIGYPFPEEEVHPGVECRVAYEGDRPVARLGMEVAHDLQGAPGASGVVGWYEAVDGEAGAGLLRAACEELAGRGVSRVLGPMNGSTWKRYRLALPPGSGEEDPQPFLTEPVNPPGYPSHFLAAGFRVAADYESRLAPRPADGSADTLDDAGGGDRGFTVHPLDPSRFEDALREIFEMSLAAFADNLYYTPIGFEEFAAAYRRVRPLVDPELVRLARRGDGRLLGFVFAFPDPFDRAGRGYPRVVLKTLATAPEARGMGIGGRLTAEIHRAAFARGAPAILHALMHVANASTRISGRHHGELFRRYALYEWTP